MSKKVNGNKENNAISVSSQISKDKERVCADTTKKEYTDIPESISLEENNINIGQEGFFRFNHKYANICLYVLLIVFFSTIIYMLINNWSDTKKFIYNLFGVLSPFFAAILIAYFVSPIVGRFEKIIQKYIAKGKHKKLVWIISMVLAYQGTAKLRYCQ